MIAIVAKSTLKPGCKEEFLRLAAELVEKSQQEAGNCTYDLYEDFEDENRMVFVETWRDQAAIDEHNASEHFTRIVPQMGKLRLSSEVAHYRKAAL